MRKILLLTALLSVAAIAVKGQTVSVQSDGRGNAYANEVTLFRDFCPAVITLATGKTNRQREANVFLKNGALMFKQGGQIMEANMDIINSASFNDHKFIKIGNKLAEVIDSCQQNTLAVVRTININGLNNEILNKSTITNIDMGDQQLGVTRMDANSDQLSYPIDETYYFIVNGKPILAQEREAKRAAGRNKKVAYENTINARGFRWTNPDCLMQILRIITD